ncbi:DUF418 domain-containing protein [Pseudonocardia sichuanensis]
MTGAMTGPTTTRKLAPDLARGVMLLLIAMAYAGVYAGVGFGEVRPEGLGVPDTVARFVTVLVLDNRAFPMFAILYGYGLAWMVARQRRAGAAEGEIRRLLRRRSLLLIAFGAVHALLVFPGEILASYGLAGLVVGWLLFRPDRTIRKALVLLALGYVVTVALAMTGMWAAGPAAQFALPGYSSAADWTMRLSGVIFSPLLIALAYPLFLLVVLGFAAGRRGLLDDPGAHRPLLRRIAVGGIAVSLLGALPAALIGVGAVALGVVPTGLLLALQVLTGVCGGAGYAAAFALLALRLEDRPGPLTRAVAAVGQRSLTFYLFDSVLVALVLHTGLLGLGAHVDSVGALTVALGVWLLAVALAAWLARTGRPGPADALMRRLVYRRDAA